MTIAAIPTMYAGIQMRSRLEAKWAAAFDLLGWQWTYEPEGYAGRIPDFLLHLHRPILVEIKPARSLDELHRLAVVPKVSDHEVLLLGEDLLPGSHGCSGAYLYEKDLSLGLLTEGYWPTNQAIGSASPHLCLKCGRLSFFHSIMSFTCRVCGAHDGDHYLGQGYAKWKEILDKARNAVQWRSPRKAG